MNVKGRTGYGTCERSGMVNINKGATFIYIFTWSAVVWNVECRMELYGTGTRQMGHVLL
jgi:hypothetical protein